jgi:hypothetical protein
VPVLGFLKPLTAQQEPNHLQGEMP